MAKLQLSQVVWQVYFGWQVIVAKNCGSIAWRWLWPILPSIAITYYVNGFNTTWKWAPRNERNINNLVINDCFHFVCPHSRAKKLEISCEQTNDLQARNQPPNGNWQESSWDIRNISFSFYFASTGCVCSWILNTRHIKTYIANTHSAFLSKQKSLNDNFICARLAVIWSVRKILYFIFQWKLPNESLAMAVFSNF